jgi:hypothetical protein
MKVLKDSTGLLAVLINCRMDEDRLLCGAAVFRQITVSDRYSSYQVKIPDSVKQVATYQLLADSQDNLEIELCAQ